MTRALSVFIRNFLSCLMVAGAFVAASAYAQVGTFQFVIGDVRVRNAAGVERPAVQGVTVNERDTIVSGATGEAQLLMVDNAFVAIRRNTELRIDQYNYKGRNDGTESGVLHLVKGTFRALTGLIVRNNKQNFTMKTAVSTIGIRGTGNITHHEQGANVTTNHTVTGSHSVTSVDPATGSQIGITTVTSPGVTVQVTRGQPPRQIPTPTFILAEASRDPKEKKAEPAKKEEAKPAPRSESLARAEAETRESQPEAPKQEPPAPPAPPSSTVEAVVVTQTPEPPQVSSSEQQLLQASLRTQLEGLFLQAQATLAGALSSVTSAQTSATSAQTSATATQTSATSAQTSAANAAAVTGADLTTLDTKIASASSLLAFAPSIQPSVTAAQSSRTTAFNAAGVVSGTLNPSSSLASAQTAAQAAAAAANSTAPTAPIPTAQTAVTTAQNAIPTAQAAATATQTAFNAAQATYQAALAALTAGNIVLAQQLLDQLKIDANNVAAQAAAASAAAQTAATAAQTAATAASSAASSATTAASQLTAASSAVNTANTAVASGIASADSAINVALGNINAIQQAANTSATNAANSVTTIQGLQTNVNTVNTSIGAINLVDTAPATTAISDATTAIGTTSSGATLAVNNANALSLASAQTTATTNATTSAGLATTAGAQVTNATTVYDANGNVTTGVGGTNFRDSTAVTAFAAMSTAKTSLDTANTAVQTAKSTVDTQVTTLASEKSAATTALSNANTALGSATTSLGTANTQNTNITNAKTAVTADFNIVNTQLGIAQTAAGSGTTTLDPSPTTASSTFASGCGSALACSDLATQYVNAAVAAVPGSVAQASASNNALTAQGRAATFEQTAAQAVTAAQTAANDAPVQLTAAQNAFTAGTTAAGAAATSAGTGATGAQGYTTTATTAATNAQTAATTGGTALTTSNTNLTTAQTDATTVAAQSIIAQYSNPTIANTGAYANRFGSTIRAPREVATGQYERVFGESDTQPNTTFVLDGNKNLVQHRDTSMLSTPGVVGPSFSYADADVKFSGGTAFDNAVLFDPANPNYMALGRWRGGTITVDDQANGVGVDQTISLGPRSVHWGIAFAPPAGYVQNLTGTTTYTTKLANTSPTDASGNVGTLNTATLSANFAAQTVNAGVNLTIASKTIDATATNLPITNSGFGGSFGSVTCSTGCTYNGRLDGTFAGENAAAAAFGYDLWSGANPYTDLIQGVVALSTGTPPLIAPKPDANIATAYHTSGGSSATTFQAIGTGYTLDLGGNLIQVSENPALTDNVESQAISGGTSPVQGTGVAIAGGTINYGRWQDGSVSGVNFNGAFGPDTVQGAYHWMKGPVIGPFYLTQALTGTVTYGSPFGMVTDQAGVAGTLNTEATSTFSVNFTQQFVNFDIRATTGAGNWRGQGTSVGLEDSGQFFAFAGSTQPHRNMTVSLGGVTTGSFGQVDGTFMGNGVEGVGMAFVFGQGTSKAAGTIGFTGPAQSQTAQYVVGLLAAGMTEAGAIAGNAEYDYLIGGGMNATSRVLLDTDDPTRVRRLDGFFPIPQPTGCITGCTSVSETPATFSTKSFGSPPPTGTLASGVTNTGNDPTTGITWGRYNSGMQVNDRVDGTVINPDIDLRTNNWHYIVGPMQTSPTVLPTTGVATYAVVGNTNPTNNVGQVGTLGSATLSADFSAKTVNVGVNISGTVGTWAASASGVPIQQGTFFDAKSGGAPNLSVTSSVTGTTSGRIAGGFTGTTGQGAMMSYSLNAGGNVATNPAARTVSGVVGFQKP